MLRKHCSHLSFGGRTKDARFILLLLFYEDTKAAIEYDRQRREESARRDAEARANAERAPTSTTYLV